MSDYLTVQEVADMARATHRAERRFRDLIARNPETPAIYVIQSGERGPIKIGYVSRIDRLIRRLGSIQTGCAEPLILRRLLTPTGPIREMETILHEWFDPFRMQGEWFEPAPHVVRFAKGRG